MNFRNVSYETHITVVKGFYKYDDTYVHTLRQRKLPYMMQTK